MHHNTFSLGYNHIFQLCYEESVSTIANGIGWLFTRRDSNRHMKGQESGCVPSIGGGWSVGVSETDMWAKVKSRMNS